MSHNEQEQFLNTLDIPSRAEDILRLRGVLKSDETIENVKILYIDTDGLCRISYLKNKNDIIDGEITPIKEYGIQTITLIKNV